MLRFFAIATLATLSFTLASSSPAVEQENLRVRCKAGKEPLACFKFRAIQALDSINSQNTYQLTDSVSLVRNSESTSTDQGSSGDGVEDAVERLISTHDVRVAVPEMIGGGSVTLSPRSLDDGKVTLSFESSSDNAVEPKSRRKSKLKKLIVPLMVFVLLKAMTLIPLALGVLGLKAWNALQLSFFSFVTSLALAIFQLCKKVAGEGGAMPVHAAAWEPHYYAARNLLNVADDGVDPGQIAYSAYQ